METPAIAHIVDDDEEPDVAPYVVAHCPLCALLEFHPLALQPENTDSAPSAG